MALRWRRLAWIVLASVVIPLALACALLFALQDRMIYFPRPYGPNEVRAGLVPIEYRTAQGAQVAFLREPRAPGGDLWVLFGGNGALALDWLDTLRGWRRDQDAFLCIDYPGYGRCEGSASPDAIADSAAAAIAAAQARLGAPRPLKLLGHSLGAAAALRVAASHPVERVVLLAPFTSLRDMAHRSVPWPLPWLLRGNFDNRARLRELAARATPPAVVILHGAGDELIPVAMGRELAAIAPGAVLRVLEDHDHNSIVGDTAEVQRAMRE